MEELKVSPKKLKEIIDESKVIGSGYFGIVLLYHDTLIKIDKYLYSKIHNEGLYYARSIIEKHYENNYHDFQDKKQIEMLYNKQKDVHLTKMPLGVLSLKDVSEKVLNISPGVILPYHKDHTKLEQLPLEEYKKLLIILKKLLLAVKELEDNKISQEDLSSYGKECIIYDRNYNVLYQDITPQIIDMGGFFVKVGDEFKNASNMYRSYSDILIDYYYFYKIHSPMIREKATTFEENRYLLDVLDYELRKK